ncbi:MAG: DUF86 domain-containing protein [Candidatus Moraniibacteriota bacterium]
MLNKELVKRKINKMEVYIEELQTILAFQAHEILADYTKLRTVERNFQLMVDTIVDINTHIISQKDLRAPEDATDTFFILEKAEILPSEFVTRFSPVAGLRNKIVHDYEDIDTEKLINDIKSGVSQFGEYVLHIDNFMNKN